MIDRNASAKKRNEHGQVITRGKPMLKVRSAVRTETGVRQATNTAHISEIVGYECSRAQQIAADTEALGDNLVSARLPRVAKRFPAAGMAPARERPQNDSNAISGF